MARAKEGDSRSYVDRFMAYDAAPDILSIVPVQKQLSKEVSEAMALHSKIKGPALDYKMEYTLLDLACGNGLVGLTSVFTLPILKAYAIDLRPRHFRRGLVEPKRWESKGMDLYSEAFNSFLQALAPAPLILVSSHPCKNLATKIVEVFNATPTAHHLFMLPCCMGNAAAVPGGKRIKAAFGGYEAWAHYLATLANGDYYMDNSCLSPCRAVVHASKEGV